MIFTETSLAGAFIIDIEPHEDERGFFALAWSARSFEERGLDSHVAETNISFNKRKGTLRGMHFQREPFAQAKIVSCTQGAIYDVILDLRKDSPSFRQWIAIELSAQSRRRLYLPKGFAHGFQTLDDNAEVFYQMTDPYVPESSDGVRWNDPAFNINWPADERTISARDQAYPDFAS